TSRAEGDHAANEASRIRSSVALGINASEGVTEKQPDIVRDIFNAGDKDRNNAHKVNDDHYRDHTARPFTDSLYSADDNNGCSDGDGKSRVKVGVQNYDRSDTYGCG